MSDLRFFADVMCDIIERERQLAALFARARAYENECKVAPRKSHSAQIASRLIFIVRTKVFVLSPVF